MLPWETTLQASVFDIQDAQGCAGWGGGGGRGDVWPQRKMPGITIWGNSVPSAHSDCCPNTKREQHLVEAVRCRGHYQVTCRSSCCQTQWFANTKKRRHLSLWHHNTASNRPTYIYTGTRKARQGQFCEFTKYFLGRSSDLLESLPDAWQPTNTPGTYCSQPRNSLAYYPL